MAVYTSDSFTGSNGAAWSSSVWATGNGTSSRTIQGNRGRMVALANYANQGVRFAPTLPPDSEVTGLFRMTGAPTVRICLRSSAQVDGGRAYYLQPNANNSFALYRDGSQTSTYADYLTLASGSAPSGVSFATDTQFRFQVVTSSDRVTLRAKFWLPGAAEPSAWTLEAADTSANRITTAGQYGGFRVTGGGTSDYVDFDDVVVQDPTASSTTPPASSTTVDPSNLYRGPQQVDNFLANNPELAPLAAQPAALWINAGGDIGKITSAVQAAAGKTIPLAIYAIPGRDSGNYSAGGFPDRASYLSFITQVKDAVGTAPAILVFEPDALGLTPAMSSTARAERIETLRQAVDILATIPNGETYIDASKWISIADQASMLASVDVGQVAGFSLNVSGYDSEQSCHDYGAQLIAELAARGIPGKRYVYDSSRNGSGPLTEADRPLASPWLDTAQAWCNPPKRTIGRNPGPVPGVSGCRAALWIKSPGESDGSFPTTAQSTYYGENAPAAGAFWLAQARDLLGLSPQKSGAVAGSFAANAVADFSGGFGALVDNGELTIVNGRARLPVASTYPYAGSASNYTVVGNTHSAEVIPGPRASGATEQTIQMLIESTAVASHTRVRFQLDVIAGTIQFGDDVNYYDANAVTVTYDASAMRFLRFREAGGTLYWETSPSGLADSWTTRRSKARPSWMTSTANQKATFTTYASSGTSSYVDLDNVNVTPSSGGTTPAPAVTRTNLARNPSWENNITDSLATYGNAAASTRDTTTSVVGGASLKITAPSGSDLGAIITFPALPAGVYTFSAWTRTSGVDNNAALVIRRPDTYATLGPEHHVTGTTDWTRRQITFTAPGGIDIHCVTGLGSYGATSGGTIWVDGLLLEAGDTLGPYFDGSYSATAGREVAWSGTPHASTSTEKAASSVTATPATVGPSATLGALTVVRGAVTRTPATIASTATVGTLTAAPGAVQLTPGTVAPSGSIGAVTAVPGPVTATPLTRTSTATIGVLTPRPGSVTKKPATRTSTATIGVLTVLTGPVTVQLAGIASTSSTGAPTALVGDVTATPATVDTGASIGSPALVPFVVATPATVVSGAVLGTPSASTSLAATPATVPSGASIGQPTTAVGPVTATPLSRPSVVTFGAVQLLPGAVTATPSSVGSTSSVGTPSTTLLPITVTPTSATSTNAFGTPSLQPGPVTRTPATRPSGAFVGTFSAIPGPVTATPASATSSTSFGQLSTEQGPFAATPAPAVSTNTFGTIGVVALDPLRATPVSPASSASIGQPTTAVGPVTATPTTRTSSSTIGSPAVLPGPRTATPATIPSSSTAGTPTRTVGPVTRTPATIPSSSSLGSISPSVGPITVALAGIASTASVGSYDRVPGPVAATPGTVPSSSTIGSVETSASYTARPGTVASSSSVGVYTPAPGPVTARPSSVPSGATIGAPTHAVGPVVRTVGGLASTATLGAPPDVLTVATIKPQGLASSNRFGTPLALPGSVTARPSSAVSRSTIPVLTVLVGDVTRTPASVVSSNSFGRPTTQRIGGVQNITVTLGPLRAAWAASGLRARWRAERLRT